MKSTMRLRSLAAALSFAVIGLCATPGAWALEVSGVNVPEQVTSGADTLVLNGAGLRQKFVFHIYVAALYLPQATQDAQAIINSTAPRILHLTLMRDINSKALTDALNAGLKDNCTAEELASLAPSLQSFEAMMQHGGEGTAGDPVVLAFNAQGVSVSFKDKALGRVDDPRFAAALLKVWLGNTPAQESLKSALLGQK